MLTVVLIQGLMYMWLFFLFLTFQKAKIRFHVILLIVGETIYSESIIISVFVGSLYLLQNAIFMDALDFFFNSKFI
jgi:hypothetical protein